VTIGEGTPDDRHRWEERYAARSVQETPPSAWVLARCLELSPDALIVDVAGGLGRHARPLARVGRRVACVDFVEHAVAEAKRAEPCVLGVVAEAAALPFADAALDALLVVNFLERALFPRLRALLRPGGALIVETYTVAHRELVESGRARGPRNPAYRLAPGELLRLIAPLRVVAAHEGLTEDAAGVRYVAGVVAVNEGEGEGRGSREERGEAALVPALTGDGPASALGRPALELLLLPPPSSLLPRRRTAPPADPLR
jgi:tellurite methyltransferase